MATEVVNVATGADFDIYIGRPSRWGNPIHLRHEDEREQVVAAYRRWLWGQIQSEVISLEDLAELHGKRLGCWCAPLACHGDVLARAAEWANAKRHTDRAA